MVKDLTRLRKIYDKTDGQCHICHKPLSFNNHGKQGYRGSWHIDHSVPKAKSGTDHLNNLYPACISCNIEKGVNSSYSARKKNGKSRVPYNKERKKHLKANNLTGGIIVGGLLGSFFGPFGIAAGIALGAVIGDELTPKS